MGDITFRRVCVSPASGLRRRHHGFPLRDHEAPIIHPRNRYRTLLFLFALLNHAYQIRNPAAAPDTDANIDKILFEHIPMVEKLLDRADAVSHGAISAHVSRLTGRNLESLRRGQWFESRK